MMPPRRLICHLGLLGLIVGCGASGSPYPDSPTPHGGRLVRMTDGKAFVEVVKKDGSAPISSEVTFYFFRGNNVPYKPAPKSGVLLLDDQQKVTLESEGDALVTPTGPVLFKDKEVDGRLQVEFDGGVVKTVRVGLR